MDTIFDKSAHSSSDAVSEQALVVPTLLILAQAERLEHGPVSTFQLHEILSQMIAMSEDDIKPMGSDHVPRFRRTVQNMISHELLTGKGRGWATKTKEGLTITPEGRGALLDILFSDPREIPSQARVDFGSQTRIVENMVAFQMLIRLAELHVESKAPVSTTQLRSDIKNSIPLSASDLKPLKNRRDHKIDQIIRNVISHKTLTRKGFAEASDKGLSITLEGKGYVLDNILSSFPAPNFTYMVAKEKEFQDNVNQRRSRVARENYEIAKKLAKPKVLRAKKDDNAEASVAKTSKRIKLG